MVDSQIPTVAVVTFPADADLDTRSLRQLLETAGPEYTRIAGLRRKYFLAGDGVAGGVYEWASRLQAEAFYDEVWYDRMRRQSGAEPEVRLFDSPAIADGVNHHLEIYLPES